MSTQDAAMCRASLCAIVSLWNEEEPDWVTWSLCRSCHSTVFPPLSLAKKTKKPFCLCCQMSIRVYVADTKQQLPFSNAPEFCAITLFLSIVSSGLDQNSELREEKRIRCHLSINFQVSEQNEYRETANHFRKGSLNAGTCHLI